MTKAQIQALIDLNLADFSNIEPVRHREVENAILDFIDKPINRGTIYSVDAGSNALSYVYTGDMVSAVNESAATNYTILNVTVAHAMPSMNYKVVVTPESVGNMLDDSKLGAISFKKVSTTTFKLGIGSFESGVQDIKLHVDVIAL